MAVQSAWAAHQRSESIAVRPDGTGFDFVVNATFAIEASKTQKQTSLQLY